MQANSLALKNLLSTIVHKGCSRQLSFQLSQKCTRNFTATRCYSRIATARQYLVKHQFLSVPNSTNQFILLTRHASTESSSIGEEVSPVKNVASQSSEAVNKISDSAVSSSPPTAISNEVDLSSVVVDSIPEPPPVPISVEDLVTDIAATAGGLKSLGLGGWSPIGLIQHCLDYFYTDLGLPWWGSILVGTVIVRVLLFPLVIKSQKNAAKMNNNLPQLQHLQMKMTQARQSGNAMMAAKYGNDMMLFMKEKDISPLKSMMVPLAMAPVFISFFIGLRRMANLPMESMKTGGLFWFADLTIPDPLYILPIITSITILITFEIGADGLKLQTSQHANLMKYVMRGIPILIFPFAINFPAAILTYWTCTNLISLLQVSMLKIPAVREKLGIEKLKQIPKDALPLKSKGFKDSVKESWTNMKITKQMEERERYDELAFKRAGRGPVPKTYKYDPTKISPSVQAKQQDK